MKAFSLLALVWGVVGEASALTLVDRGQPRGQIVVAPNAPEEVQEAARELRRVLHKMSGADLPIVAPTQATGPVQVLIGDVGSGPEAPFEPELGYSGYRIQVNGHEVRLRGHTAAGTANAVYGFLQDTLGVRWLFPSELFEVVPQRPTITVAPTDERHVPDFVCRLFSGLYDEDSRRWARHLRLTGGGWEVPFAAGFTHWLYRIYPPSLYGATHPEYYPLIGGVRRIPTADGEQLGQPCTSNPGAIQVAVDTVRRYFDEHPEAHTYSLSINDNNTWCECDSCRALDVYPRVWRGRPIYSERYYTFVNAVAREVRRTHPDKFVGCFAYWGVEPPPQNIRRMEPNVFINVTQDSSQYFDPDYRAEDYRLIAAWKKKCAHLGKYDYYGLGALLPRYYPHLLAADLKSIHALGLEAFHAEVYPYWANFGPQIYLAARLLWEVDQDPNALLDELFEALFEAAAEDIKSFYQTFETAWMRPRKGQWFEGIGSFAQQAAMFTPADVSHARRCLSRALRRAPNATVAARIRYLERGFRYPELLLRGWQTAEAVRRAPLATAADADWLARQVKRLAEVLEAAPRAWQTSVLEDPIMPNWYKEGARPAVRGQWQSACDGALAQALPRLVAWYEAQGKGPPAEALSRSLGLGAPGSRLDLITRALRGEFDGAPNLVPNPGFEETAPGADHPVGPDWRGEKAPPGWSTWQEEASRGTFFLDTTQVHRGQRSAALRGGNVLCYLTRVPIQTGRRYVCQGWARADGVGPGRRTTVEVRWQDAEGRWFTGAPDEVAEVATPNTWERLVLPFTAPEGAAQAVILLIAYGLEEGREVWFDDISLVPAP
jgi:hypothetical protein